MFFRTDWPFDNQFESVYLQLKQEYEKNYDEFVKEKDNIIITYPEDYAKGEWKSTWLSYNNEFHPAAEKYFPKTVELLKSFDCVFHSQFSTLKPRSYIVPHNGIDKDGLLRGQLVLSAPDDAECKLFASAGEDTYNICQTEGSSFFFDDRCLHWTGNPSYTQSRTVIMFDFWPPGVDIKTYSDIIYQRIAEENVNKRAVKYVEDR